MLPNKKKNSIYSINRLYLNIEQNEIDIKSRA